MSAIGHWLWREPPQIRWRNSICIRRRFNKCNFSIIFFGGSDDLTLMISAISKLHSTCVLCSVDLDVHNIGYKIDQIQKAFVFFPNTKKTRHVMFFMKI